MCENGVAASVFCDEGLHCTYTTNVIQNASNSTSSSSSSSSSSSTSNTNVSSDSVLEADMEEPEWWVEEILEKRKKKSGVYKYRTKWSTGEITWETFSCFIDVDRLCTPFLKFVNQDDWKQGLSSWSKARLQELCKTHGFSRTGNKEKLRVRVRA